MTVRYGSRYPSEMPAAPPGRCAACGTALPSRRACYCSTACKQRAYRLRQIDVTTVEADHIRADLRRRRQVVDHTIYECSACEARYLGVRQCPDCHLFTRALGPGGACPHCDEPVLVADLLES